MAKKNIVVRVRPKQPSSPATLPPRWPTEPSPSAPAPLDAEVEPAVPDAKPEPPEFIARVVSMPLPAQRFIFFVVGLLALALVFVFARSPAAIAAAVGFACALFAWATMFDGRSGN